MSEERNFDKFIRSEFRHYSPKVPPHIWENIAAERKDRKPVGFWFTLFSGANLIWLGALLVTGSVGAFIIFHNYTTTYKTNTSKPEAVITNPINTSASINNTTAQALTPSTTSSVPATIALNNNDSKKKEVEFTPIATSTIADNTIKSKRITGWHLFKRKGIFATKTKVDIGRVTDEENPFSTGAENNINNTYTGTTNTAAYSKLQFPKALLLSYNIKTPQSALRQKNLPECPTLEEEAAGNKRYIEFYISPDYAIRTLTDTANSAYLQKRKASTSVSSAFSAGIRYTKVFNNGMSIRFGLNYSQINETFTYVQGNVVQTTYTIDPITGDTTGSYTVRGANYKTTYNHYRYFDIPITIGYELGNGRFHANINAGIIANIYSWQKGDELDSNYTPISITTGKGPATYQFRTNIGFGATGGASLYYKLTDQLHFMAEPYIRYNFQPLSNSNLTLRQNYTTIGLRVGLRFDLHNPGSVINK